MVKFQTRKGEDAFKSSLKITGINRTL